MAKEIETIRALCADIVQKAKSGHPGAPLGLSQFVYILYTEFLNLNPDNPRWINRDIFILSNGHACVIQYVMNFLMGFLSFDDLFHFRQLNSNTPGHSERNLKGIEATTGPLGQGVAASVGFAISSKLLQKTGFNNKIYCIFGDGCYQEGISQEAFSLCSKLNLDNITFIYDFNKSTIDGSTNLSMKENVKARFESLNFEVIEINDEQEAIRSALKKKNEKPKVIILHTVIAKDTSMQGDSKAHGAPLGEDNIAKLKEYYCLPPDKFHISEDLKIAFEKAKERMKNYVSNNRIEIDQISNLKLQNKLLSLENSKDFEIQLEYTEEYTSADNATRNHLKNCINTIQTNDLLLSGSADLLPCIKSQIEGTSSLSESQYDIESYIHYGIREHAMCGIMNGIADHGIFLPIGGTFLNFSMYGMPAIRLGCIDKLKIIYIFTHDSIGLGEDGPTHQPVEALATLRALPNIITLRPCDGRETRSALAIALKNNGPTALILTRQVIPDLKETYSGNKGYCAKGETSNSEVEKGAYFLIKDENPEIILLATGSEVQLAIEAKEILKSKRISVVSMISFELFENQSTEYKNSIIPKRSSTQNKKPFVVSIEALSTFGWGKYSDFQIGMDSFGRSAPFKDVLKFFKFTGQEIADQILSAMKIFNSSN